MPKLPYRMLLGISPWLYDRKGRQRPPSGHSGIYINENSSPTHHIPYLNREHSVNVPSQWEMMLHCNIISYWLGTYTKWSLSKILQWFQIQRHPWTILSQILTRWHGNMFHITGPLWRESNINQWIPLTKGQYCRALMLAGKSQVADDLSLGMPWCSCVVTVIRQETPYRCGVCFMISKSELSFQWPSCLHYVLLDPNLLFLFLGNRSRGKDCHDDCPVDCLAVTGSIDGSWPYWYFLKQCLTVTPDSYFFSCKNRSMV